MANAKSGGVGEGEQSPFAQCKTNHAPTCTVNDIEYTLTDNYYVANLEYPSDYDTQASDCTGSTYEHCSDSGDYYNAAKRYCETSGGRLPTITELQAGDYTNGFFWASEEYNSSNAYFLFNGEVHDNTKSFPLPQVVCVGK